jgi:cysteine-S-conjugate beta-lyase
MSNTSTRSPLDEEIDRRQVPALKVHTVALGSHGERLFAAGVADMDFKAPPPVLSAMQRRLDHGVFGYESVAPGLLPALVRWQSARHAWEVDVRHILRAPNVLNTLAIAASLFTDAGDAVIVQPPVFFDFFDVLRENHRTLVSSALLLEHGRYRMDFEDLERKAALPHAKMLFLCNPHNPVGRVWSADELRQLGDICKRHGVVVVSDEMHADITLFGRKYTPFASLGPSYADICITCLSPAKSFNIAACCCSFTVIANDEMRRAFQVENSRLTVNKNNAFANMAMQAAYTDGGRWLGEVLSYLEKNVALVRDHLASVHDVQLIEPEGTFLVWLDFRALALTPTELTSFLRCKAGWAVTRGEAFGSEGRGFARVNVACPRTTLQAALDQLTSALSTKCPVVCTCPP